MKTGPVAALGIPQGNGMVDYMEYINEHGGINGRKIKMLWEDDGFQAPKSVAAVKKLITRDKVLTIMTTGGTNQTIANMKNIKRYKIANIPNAMALEFFEPLNPTRPALDQATVFPFVSVRVTTVLLKLALM